MHCPKCQFDNADGMNFCGKCGTKLERSCPQCNFSNPSGYEFCGKCGYNLSLPSESATTRLSFDEKLAKIQKYLPKGLTEKILSQKERIEGERKQVTVMFCDMEGFTSLSEKIGPEDAYAMMDQVYEILIHKVHDYGGTVNEMTGDGIVALFGAPIALEDAPQRAIRSALAIHKEMVKFTDKLKNQRQIHPIRMRVGIHTGPVVVGSVGNDLRVEFKAVGDTVNLASRLEEIAESGTTYVTDEIFKLTEGLFRFEGLGEREFKGKDKPVKVYRVLAPSTSRTRFDVSSERGLTPLVGRHRELELLLDGFERAKSGRGQAFSIVAEAGLGKSRLLYEFRKVIANENVTFLEGKSLSYSRDIAYHPIIEILKIYFKIQGNDSDIYIKEKVKAGLLKLQLKDDSILPYFLELLSVKESGINKIPSNPDLMGDRIREALKQLILKGSEIDLLIVAVEDLHWIDSSSEETLKYLLENLSGAKVLLIFTYRPEFVHTWGGRSYHSQINLMRLSNRESLAIVSSLLGSEKIDSSLGNLILDKTEGVPFYIEEFTKSLKDLEIIDKKNDIYLLQKDYKAIAIPSRIQDVIMARVDTLSEDAKEILQFGSVIGREFSHSLIEQVTEMSDKVLFPLVAIMKNSELIYERGIYPESVYIFKHALTQESVYHSLIKNKLQKYHQIIANKIEQTHSEIIDKEPELLAYHYTKADEKDKAIIFWKKAGQLSMRRSANNEAISHLTKGIELLRTMPETSLRTKHEIDMIIDLGSALTVAKGQSAPEVEEALSRAYDLCQLMDDSSNIFPALLGLWSYYQGRGQHHKPHMLAQQLLIQAKNTNDTQNLIRAYHALGTSCFYLGELTEAESYYACVLSLYIPEQYGDSSLPFGTHSFVACKVWTAWIHWYLGYPEKALIESKDAVHLSKELSHPHSLVFGLLITSRVHQYRRECKETQTLAQEVISLSVEHSFPLRIAAGTFMKGWALAEQGHMTEGLTQMHQGVTNWNATGGLTNLTYFNARLAEMYGKEGDHEKGLGIINDALNFMENSDERFCEAELYQIKGDLLLQQTDNNEQPAETCFQKALEVARTQQAKSLELRAAMSMSRLWQSQGKIDEARNLLSRVYNWFTEGFDTPDLKHAKALLEGLS